ncbi:MAG: fibronectin type III-like domain-contianing protein, partial [Bacteroidales bacterium]|nr:fibronectin type III-like domain-contianing protein [Bacteroidales bacterium]
YNYDANTPVQWPFGFGLSYSDVKVSELKLLEKGDVLRFGVTLTNNSDRAVKEPVLLFISDLVATLTPDIKRLRAFEKVSLEAGESKNIELSVRIADLAFVNEDLNWVLEPGEFRASVGDQSVTFAL